jgi:Ca2+:H+ antiporter
MIFIHTCKWFYQQGNGNAKGNEANEGRLATAHAVLNLFLGRGSLSWFLLVGPLSLWAVYREWSDTCIFWLTFIVMIPLAAILGDFTEEVALHTNEVTGGLINASFGNAVEVVVVIQALLANEIRVVQASMLGSIFSNLLLVLGS